MKNKLGLMSRLMMAGALVVIPSLLTGGCETKSDRADMYIEIRMQKHEMQIGGNTETLYDCKKSENPEEREKGKVIYRGQLSN